MGDARAMVWLVMFALVIAGCGRRPQPVPVPEAPSAVQENPPPPVTDAPSETAAPAAPLTEEEIFARKTLDELNAERPLVDVFFDFDQWNIRDDARPALQKNVEWLRRWSSTRATIEGHCDSRGTSEYNLALGDRRAHAVRDYLVSLGISPERLLVVSKGEETPFCENDTEGCWQENRRAHFVITAK
jgi:peptidoglycan-associated lipoprotein